MTNAELIEKIRAEIERLYNDKSYSEDRWDMGYDCACEDMMSFLSTLEESEKPINLDDAMKELDEKIALVKQRGTWKGVDVDKYMDEVRGRESEKPMNQKGLDVTDFCKPIDPGIAQCIADHSWEMLGEDEKPAPDDLEEAAMNYIAPIENEDGLKVINFSGQDIKDAFIAGWKAKEESEKPNNQMEIVNDLTSEVPTRAVQLPDGRWVTEAFANNNCIYGRKPEERHCEYCSANCSAGHDFQRTKGLDDAANAYSNEHNDDCFDAIGSVCPHIIEAFKAGYNLCKEQMLKGAVEGIAVINANAKTDGFGYVRSDYLPDDFLRELGNFRLVIVKEDAE